MLSRSTLRDLENEAQRLTLEREATDRRLTAIRVILSAYADASIDADSIRAEPKSLRNELVAILQETGHPLHYKELYERLLERGITVNGKDPAKNVGAQLSNDMRFQKVGGGRWVLASQTRHRSVNVSSEPYLNQAQPTSVAAPEDRSRPAQDDHVLQAEWDPSSSRLENLGRPVSE